jgi:undecaprenyl-diphosphatase
MISTSESIILGIIEGLSEFLPISSTGHLILSSYFLDIPESDFLKAFQIIIQAAAMCAVIIEYQESFFRWAKSVFLFKTHSQEFREVFGLFLAFVPAGFLGYFFGKPIKTYFFNPVSVSIALIVGGVVILILERKRKVHQEGAQEQFRFPSPRACFQVGLFQCLALIPGVSRSLATILGGKAVGLSQVNATQFSFFLAVPTLLAASGYDLLKNRELFLGSSGSEFLGPLFWGSLFSFLTAWLCIRVFLKFIRRHSFALFGWYRIGLGIATLIVAHLLK